MINNAWALKVKHKRAWVANLRLLVLGELTAAEVLHVHGGGKMNEQLVLDLTRKLKLLEGVEK